MSAFDISAAEKEAKAEIAKERGEIAKKAIKAKLRQIEDARKIVSNLELEYGALLQDLGAAA